MKIALIGATGNAGSRVLAESLSRGHSVRAIVRNPPVVSDKDGLDWMSVDVGDIDALAAAVAGADAAISSLHFLAFDPAKMIAAIRKSGVKRYLVVGGAGGLNAGDGKRVIDMPGGVPEPYQPESNAGIAFHAALKEATDLDWTFVSPSAEFVPGERTGEFRIGGDDLLTDEKGRSWISYEDFSVAVLNEIEQAHHVRRRFTVGY